MAVVPGAQVVVLPGVGHTPMFEDPAALCVMVTDFAVEVGGH